MSNRNELIEVDAARTKIVEANIQQVTLKPQDLYSVSLRENVMTIGVSTDADVITYGLQQKVLSNFRKSTGISKDILKQLTGNDTLSKNVVKYILSQQEEPMSIVTSHNTVIDVEKGEGVFLDPTAIFDYIISRDIGIIGVAGINIQDKGVRMNFVTEVSAERPRKVGELSHAGFIIDVNGDISIKPYVYTLVCTNGLIGSRMDQVVRANLPTMEEARHWLDEVIMNVQSQAEHFLNYYVNLDNQIVDQPGTVISAIAREHGLANRHIANMQERVPVLLAEAPDNAASMYDIIGLMTNYAQSCGRDSQYVLESVAGTVSEEYSEHIHCPQCNHIVK